MAESCKVCQEHQRAYDDAPSETERRMVMVLWRHHDSMSGHHVFRYHDADEGMTVADMGATVPPW